MATTPTRINASIPQDIQPLEFVEFELALAGQSVVEHGFAASVGNALDCCGGSLLFEMPAAYLEGVQRVAAVVIGEGDERRPFLLTLAEDGVTIAIEDAETSDASVASFALSCFRLSPWLDGVEAQAA